MLSLQNLKIGDAVRVGECLIEIRQHGLRVTTPAGWTIDTPEDGSCVSNNSPISLLVGPDDRLQLGVDILVVRGERLLYIDAPREIKIQRLVRKTPLPAPGPAPAPGMDNSGRRSVRPQLDPALT